MRLLLIRHAATPGNLERRYVGTTDEGLSVAGRASLLDREWPPVELVAASPMRRCVETAALIYPEHSPILVPGFREIDFGEFEYKTADELLQSSPAYQAWIDSGGALPFPGGESREAFAGRCVAAFERLMQEQAGACSVAIVAHGGTLMSILSRFAVPSRPYFDWQLPNGGMLTCEWRVEGASGGVMNGRASGGNLLVMPSASRKRKG